MPQSNFNAIELLNLSVDSDDSTRREIQLQPSIRVKGVILDPQGEPLNDANIYGLADDRFHASQLLGTNEFAVTGLGDGEERKVLFRHEGRRLSGP